MAGTTLKGITIELNGDTRGLTSALKSVNAEVKTTQNDLKKVEKLLKLDPKNTELLAQKQKLLAQAVNETKEKLNVLKTAAEQANEQMANGKMSEAQYMEIRREIIETEQSLKDLEKAAQRSNVVLEQVGAVAGKVAEGANKVADATKGISAAAGGALAALGGMAYKAVTGADDLNTLAKQTGFTTDELQKFQYAADLVDVSVETITGAATKMKKGMTEAGIAVGNVTVQTVDASGKFRSVNDIFFDVIQALSRVTNETERDQIAMQIFGKSADQLAGIIDDGGASLRAYGKEAEELGLILSGETLDGLNAVNDQFDRLKAQAKGRLMEAGAKALEAALPVIERMVGILETVLNFIGSLNAEQIALLANILLVVAAISPVASIVAKIAGAVQAVLPLLPIITGTLEGLGTLITGVIFPAIMSGLSGIAAFITGTVIPAIGSLFAFVAANPIVLVIAAIVAAVVAATVLIVENWDIIKEAALKAWQDIQAGFQALGQTISNMASDLANAAKSSWDSVVSWITNGLQSIMNAIRSVASAIGGLFHGNTSAFNYRLPMMANGGTLRSGSAIVGEAGPELLTVAGGKATVTPMTATIDNKSLAALSASGGQQVVDVNVSFTGSLSQLARLLQPEITAETNRRGPSLVAR